MHFEVSFNFPEKRLCNRMHHLHFVIEGYGLTSLRFALRLCVSILYKSALCPMTKCHFRQFDKQGFDASVMATKIKTLAYMRHIIHVFIFSSCCAICSLFYKTLYYWASTNHADTTHMKCLLVLMVGDFVLVGKIFTFKSRGKKSMH